jgi:hypothetical protein
MLMIGFATVGFAGYRRKRTIPTQRATYALLRDFATITGLRRRAALVSWPQCDFDRDEIRYAAASQTGPAVPPRPSPDLGIHLCGAVKPDQPERQTQADQGPALSDHLLRLGLTPRQRLEKGRRRRDDPVTERHSRASPNRRWPRASIRRGL